MSGAVPEGPKLVGYALLPPNDLGFTDAIASALIYEERKTAELFAGFRAPYVQAVYTLPPLVLLGPDWREGVSLRQKLAWGITGAVLMGLACLAAVVIGGAA
jgi:hypothetical protein